MSRLSTYWLVLVLAGASFNLAFASTDLVSNALTQSNSYLKEAGLVQKKYSGIAREYVTNKTGNLNNLGGERAKKYQEKAKSLSEKAAKLQKWMKDAQEKKAELEQKYNELNAQAMEYKAMADDAIAEGKAIKDSYKNIKSEVESGVNGLVDEAKGLSQMAQDMKDQTLGDLQSVADIAGSSGNQAAEEGKTENSLNEETPVAENKTVTNLQDSSGGEPFRQVMQAEAAQKINLSVGQSNIVETQNYVEPVASSFSPVVRPSVSQISEIPQYNQADAIRSATYMAGQSKIGDIETYMPESISEAVSVENNISAADIMAVAATKSEEPEVVETQKSKLNIEEQLLQATNKVSSVKTQKNVKMEKMAEPNGKAVLRKKFGEGGIMPMAEPLSVKVEKAQMQNNKKADVKINEKQQLKEKTDDKAL